MQRKLYFLLFVTCLLGFNLTRAQDTFDDKRHQKGNTSKSVGIKKFNPLKIAAEKKQMPPRTGRTNFQMPSVFNHSGVPPKYEHRVLQKSERGMPLFIKSKPSEATAKDISGKSATRIGQDYLSDVAHLLLIKDPTNEFLKVSQKKDALGKTHMKMQQTYKGIKLYGSEVILHLDKSNRVEAMNGRSRPTPALKSVVPKLSASQALKSVEQDLGASLSKTKSSNRSAILTTPDFEEELIIYQKNGTEVLTRHLTVFPNLMDRWEYFIDAETGKVIDKYYHTCTLHPSLKGTEHTVAREVYPPETGSGIDLNGSNRQLSTFSVGETNYMINATKAMFNSAQSEMPDNPVGGIMTLDLRNEPPAEGADLFHVTSNTNSWNNATAVSAHYNADVSYEYFRNTFNRNSINGEGGTIISIINVADPDDGGGLDNAFWNGRAMFYGNGRVAFEPLAAALDVAGHEMSHGVIQNTANLEYRNQSGAINESFADIFGAMIDRDDWLLAEDVVNRQVFSSGAMRDMQNPNNGGSGLSDTGWQPKDMTEFYTGSANNGGVHINSGIPNRAFYLVATDIGRDKAEQIYYRALDTYLTVSSQFIDLRLAVIQSAADLHGADSPEVQAVQNAYDTVGITDGAPTDTGNDIPTAQGDDFILSLDIRDTDENTLYISDTQATEYFPLTTTRVFRKPSVADDGSFAIFVTEDNTVNAVTLDRNNPEETVLSDQSIWAAVALSKDGTKLAAVLNDESNIIFISDLVTGDFQEFELYNPTTSNDGATTGEVLYADALEWDYSGQYLIYDALNRLENANGDDIEYWDVGSLRAWDNQANTFGDGDIQKIFTNLPEGVSIGNPSFSKTSGNILAFDYLNDLNDVYEVITANIETGEVRTVYQNNKLGFPNYSKNDDKIIFDTNNGGDEDIAVINIAADKISPSGNVSALIPDGKWGIWYTVGTRSTLSSEKEITDFRFNVTNPASVGVISGNTITVSIPNNINPENLVATFASSAKSSVSVGGTLQQSGVNQNNFTDPLVYTVTAEDGSTKNFTVSLGESVAPDPNDSDDDGVPNDLDQCPNTPFGSAVDTTGCEIFSLPSDNFRVLAKGESCADSSNGTITVTSIAIDNFTATVSGGGLNGSVDFEQILLIENLEAGRYNICITLQGQTGYESCFDVTISEPQPLSVSSKTNLTARTVTLDLSGAELYTINLNDEVYTTSNSEITLPLQSEETKVTIRTDKECQGVYEETIGSSAKVIVYPNPVSSGEITVQLSASSEEKITVQLNTLDGRKVKERTLEPNETLFKLTADDLQTGIYLLYVTINGRVETYKIIKQ